MPLFVLHIALFPLIYIKHNQCPSRFFIQETKKLCGEETTVGHGEVTVVPGI